MHHICKAYSPKWLKNATTRTPAASMSIGQSRCNGSVRALLFFGDQITCSVSLITGVAVNAKTTTNRQLCTIVELKLCGLWFVDPCVDCWPPIRNADTTATTTRIGSWINICWKHGARICVSGRNSWMPVGHRSVHSALTLNEIITAVKICITFNDYYCPVNDISPQTI